MKTIQRPLLVLHKDPEVHRRLRASFPPPYQVYGISDWKQLHDALQDLPPSAVVLIGPPERTRTPPRSEQPLEVRTEGRTSDQPELRRLLSVFPSVPVITFMQGPSPEPSEVRILHELGVTDLVYPGHDDTPTAILQRVQRAQKQPLHRLLDPILPPDMPGTTRALIFTAAEVASEGGYSRDLAAKLQISHRTLLRWYDNARIPPPRKLLAWLRVLLAASLLEDPGRSIQSVSRSCGYSNDAALRRITQRFLKTSPSQMRDHGQGALSLATPRFLKALQGQTPRSAPSHRAKPSR